MKKIIKTIACAIWLTTICVACIKETTIEKVVETTIEKVVETAMPEAVDLGLPSGLKWAIFNVGATKPEEYGGYFAWGETEPKSHYNWSTYKWCNGSKYSITKYNINARYGTVDNKTILDPEDDAAHVNWGGSWRMPTYEEWTELKTLCTWTWTSQNGVNGRKVTGPNGNSIFLPAAGSGPNYAGSYGYYWSSSRCSSSHAYNAYYGSGDSYKLDGYYSERCIGFPVRPVSE